MRKNEFLRCLMERDPVDGLLPLSQAQTPDDVRLLGEKGYVIPFTAKEWQERYPSIPLEKIYCGKSGILPSVMVYYDKDKYIYLEIMYGGCPMPMTVEGDFEEVLMRTIKQAEDAYQRKDYAHLLFAFISESSGNITMRLIKDMLQNEEPSGNLYKAIISAYRFIDNAGGGFDLEDMKRLAACKTPEQVRNTQEKLADMPDEIVVYRGMGGASTAHDRSISWTTKESVAYFFAARRDEVNAMVVTGTVEKQAVVEFFDDEESEILLYPQDVKNLAATTCVPMEEFLKSFSRSPSYLRKKGIVSIVDHILDSINSVYGKKPEGDHDAEHTKRVALMACYLFLSAYIPYAEKNRFKEGHIKSMFWTLMNAAAYHDRGREDDGDDLNHGERGYAIYAQSHPKNALVAFLIMGHVVADSAMQSLYRSCKVKDIPYEEAKLLLGILKDADALDRWRFSLSSGDFVRVDMLRLPESKRLMAVAAALQGMGLE